MKTKTKITGQRNRPLEQATVEHEGCDYVYNIVFLFLFIDNRVNVLFDISDSVFFDINCKENTINYAEAEIEKDT